MKSLICAALVAGLIAYASVPTRAQGTAAKVHKTSVDKMVIESGGEIEVKSGGTLTLNGTFAGAGNIDTEKITSGAFAAARIGSGTIDTTKIKAVVTPGAGTLLCYTDDNKIGKVTSTTFSGGTDTGKVKVCAAF